DPLPAVLELPLDDGEDDRVLAVEVAVDQAGAHPGRLGDVGHARGVEPVLDEAQPGRLQDPVALAEGARLRPGHRIGLRGRIHLTHLRHLPPTTCRRTPAWRPAWPGATRTAAEPPRRRVG